MTFQVYSPDGFPIERDKKYKTVEEANEALDNFVDKYAKQGYYSTSRRKKISIEDIKENCKITDLKIR